MATKTKQLSDGSSATIQHDDQIIIVSDPNNYYKTRSIQIIVWTTNGSGIQRAVTVNQATD